MDPTAEVTPTETDVARICAIANPLVRNLQITDCYARLSRAFAARTGQRANWCTFATWASRQAGRTIRGEDLGDTLRRRLHTPARLSRPLEAIWRWLLRRGLLDPRLAARSRRPRDPHALRRVRALRATPSPAAISRCSKRSRAEFARYLEESPVRTRPLAVSSEAFIAWLSADFVAGDPPDGQRPATSGLFATIPAACRHETDPAYARRSSCCPGQSLQVGLHEQNSPPAGDRAKRLDAAASRTAEDLGQTACSARSCPSSHAMAVRRCASRPRVRSGGSPHACRIAASLCRLVARGDHRVLSWCSSLPGRVRGAGVASDRRIRRSRLVRRRSRGRCIELADSRAFLGPTIPAGARQFTSGAQDWCGPRRSGCISSCTCSARTRKKKPSSRGRSRTSRCRRSGEAWFPRERCDAVWISGRVLAGRRT